jgi:CBS domain-containing protein
MRVEELMCKAVKSCSPEHSLSDAARIMWENDCGCVPVVDPSDRVVGMITDRDIAMATYLNGAAPIDLRVRDVMSRQVLACRPTDRVSDADEIMRRAQVRRLPVTDTLGRIVGILSLRDVAVEAEKKQKTRAPDVTLDEVALTLSAVCRARLPDQPTPRPM